MTPERQAEIEQMLVTAENYGRGDDRWVLAVRDLLTALREAQQENVTRRGVAFQDQTATLQRIERERDALRRRRVKALERVFRAALAMRYDFRDAFSRGELPGTQFASESEMHDALEAALREMVIESVAQDCEAIASKDADKCTCGLIAALHGGKTG